MTGARLLLGGAFLLGLSGCPLTDDYYLEKSELDGAGSSSGGSGATAGDAAVAGSASISPAEGGASAGAASTPLGEAGSPASCVESGDERCDGRDNDCDGSIDEDACADGCVGFVLEGQSDHGYSYCGIDVAATWDGARTACAAAGMRLLWVESEAENAAVSALLLVELGGDAQVLFGANDFSKEGEWRWGPGEPFWRGNASGTAVGDAFTAWSEGVPDDASGNEDCGVLYPLSSTWGDKTCDQAFPYVCEQLD